MFILILTSNGAQQMVNTDQITQVYPDTDVKDQWRVVLTTTEVGPEYPNPGFPILSDTARRLIDTLSEASV